MKIKKKLLVLTSTFPRWENDTVPPFVYELSKRLTDDFDVHVLAPHYPEAKTFEIMENMKVYRFRYFITKYEKLAGNTAIFPTLNKNKLFYFQVPFFLIGELLALYKLTRKIKLHVIHAHWIIPQGLIAYINKKLTGFDYVVTSHGGDIFGLQGKTFTTIKKSTLQNAKSITVVSNAIKKEILEKIDSNLKIGVIPMGVDSKLFNPNKKDNSIKEKYNINGPFLLFVGRLTEKKGVKYLIEAMPKIIEKNPKTKLMIIGSGELENELKDLSEKLNVEKNIIFTGPIPNNELPRYYATADIFIGPSIITKEGDREGLPVSVMEAIASGCTVIATDLEGNKDLIENGENGFLVNEKDSRDIAKKIINLIKKPIKDKNNIRKKLINKFDWKIIKEKYGEVLR